MPSFNRMIEIKNGVKKFEPLELIYKISTGTITQKFFRDWFYKNEYKDVTLIETDATGVEVDRWLLRDCECNMFNKRTYNAGAVEFHGVNVRVICTSDPVPLEGS